MAKKKKEDVEDDRIPNYQKKILQDYGNIYIKASDIGDENDTIIPISPMFDSSILGVPLGSWVVISGPPKIGKSTLALQIIKNAQELGKPCFLANTEGRFRHIHKTSVEGLDLDKLTVIQSTPKKILSSQEHLDIATDVIKSVPESIYVIDSTSALTTTEEMSTGIETFARNHGAKILAQFTRKLNQIVPVNRNIVILLTHVYNNVTNYGKRFVVSDGIKIEYQADLNLLCTKSEKWVDEDGKEIGKIPTFEVLAAPLTCPGQKIRTFLRYGHGIDSTMEILSLAIEFGIVKKAASWLEYDGQKIQGEQKFYSYMKENPNFQSKIHQDIKNVYN